MLPAPLCSKVAYFANNMDPDHSNPIDCYCMYICLACQFESEINMFKPDQTAPFGAV